MALVPERNRRGHAGQHRERCLPADTVAVEELPFVVVASAQPVVDEYHGEVGRDPVGDRQEEVFVVAARPDLCLEGEAQPEPERSAHGRDEGAPQPQRQLEAECEERHRAAVDVEDVRADGAQDDRQQGELGDGGGE